MATYLDRILEHHRERAGNDHRSLDDAIAKCAEMAPARPFARALTGGETLAVIGEVKRRSPSKGELRADLDPAGIASAYEAGGARCLSVLTDGPHFGGSPDDLASARAATMLPVLRKDFTVSALDVCDARLMGADCVLLIVAALDDSELGDFATLAREMGLDALIETHDEAEVERALAATSAELIGVNQRDLETFEVDQERAVRVAGVIPDTAVRVAESGVRNAADATVLAGAGYHAVLVGEHVVTAPDPAVAVAALAVPRR